MKIRFLALLLMILGLLTSCGGESSGGKYSFGDGTEETEILTDLSEYTIIRGDNSDDEEKKALVTFHDAIKKSLGIDLPVSTDWVNKIQPEHEKEIIIGESSRPASEKASNGLGYNDFVIRKDGTKLVILGGSGKATIDAVDYFINNYIDVYSATLKYPKTEYKYIQTYTIDELTIDGADISEYKIFPLYEDANAEILQKALSDGIVGTHLEIAASTNDYTKYIYLDNAHLVANEYGVRIDSSGNVTVYGSHETFETALNYFETDFFEKLSSEQGKKVNITERSSVTLRTSEKDIYTKSELADLLKSDLGESIIIGENLSGSQSMPHYDLENFYSVTGKYPAALGIELSAGGLNIETLPMTEWSEVICELREYAAKGGIIYVKNYFTNPTGNYPKGNKSGGEINNLSDLLTIGTNTNTEFNSELALCGAFISALKNNNISVIWRPFPEDGDYWYLKGLSDEDKQNIYKYAEDYFVKLGLDNVITAYDGDLITSVILPLNTDEYTNTPIIETSLQNALIATTRSEQETVFNTENMLENVMSMCGISEKISILITENGMNSVEWLGKADVIASDERIITLSDMLGLFDSVG